MSVVTDIVLRCSLSEQMGDDNYPVVDEVNKWLDGEGYGELRRLNGHEGGHKSWQAALFGGAFNHFDIEEFMRALASVKWQQPEQVQILIKGENDEVFGLLNLVAPYTSRLASYETRLARMALGRSDEDEPWL